MNTPALETERLILRKFTEHDITLLHRLSGVRIQLSCNPLSAKPLMVASFQLRTAGPSVFSKVPSSMVSTPKSSFLTVFMPPEKVPPLMVRLTLALLG